MDDGLTWSDAVRESVGGLEKTLQAERLAVGRHVLAFLAETLKPPIDVGETMAIPMNFWYLSYGSPRYAHGG